MNDFSEIMKCHIALSAVAVFMFRSLVTPTLAASFPLTVLVVGVALMVINSLREQRRIERGVVRPYGDH